MMEKDNGGPQSILSNRRKGATQQDVEGNRDETNTDGVRRNGRRAAGCSEGTVKITMELRMQNNWRGIIVQGICSLSVINILAVYILLFISDISLFYCCYSKKPFIVFIFPSCIVLCSAKQFEEWGLEDSMENSVEAVKIWECTIRAANTHTHTHTHGEAMVPRSASLPVWENH